MHPTTSNKALLAILSLLLWTFPASAQLTRTTEATLKALRQGQEVVLLANTTHPSVQISTLLQLSATYKKYVQLHLNQIENGQRLLTSLQSQQAAGTASLPLDIRVKRTLAQQDALQQIQRAQHELEEILYRWGQMLDQGDALGYPNTIRLIGINNTAQLTINGQTAFVQATPSRRETVTLAPADILTQATTVRSLIQSYDLFPQVLAAENPTLSAGWFYLKTNFENAWEEFDAAQEAYKLIPNTHGLFAQMGKHSPKNQLITRNYNYAAANLALHSANILRFMSVNPTVFPLALSSYQRIIQLDGQRETSSNTFHNFWNQSLLSHF